MSSACSIAGWVAAGKVASPSVMKALVHVAEGQRLVELRAIPDDRRAFAELRQCTIRGAIMNGWPADWTAVAQASRAGETA